MPVAGCHPDRTYKANGLCKACYASLRISGNPAKMKTKQGYDKLRYQQLKEATKARAKHYYQMNLETCKAVRKEYARNNKDKLKEYHKAYDAANKRRRRPEYLLLHSAKARAKQRNVPFTITIDDIHIPTYCPALGIPLTAGIKKVHAGSPTLDRIDNSRGYTPGNILVVSHKANTIKQDVQIEDLEKIVAFYRSHELCNSNAKPNLKVYIAGPFKDKDYVTAVSLCLEQEGIGVTSRWLTQDEGNTEAVCAERDIADILRADVLVYVNSSYSEGKAVELGFAFGKGKPIVILGDKEGNVFLSLGMPAVNSIEELVFMLKAPGFLATYGPTGKRIR